MQCVTDSVYVCAHVYKVLSMSKLPTVISNYMHVVFVILKVVCVVLKAVFIDHSEGCLDFCGYSYIILY